MGRSRGGWGSKIHMIVDALGNPLTFTITAANIADISAAKPIVEQAPNMHTLIGDKGYDSDELIAWLNQRGIQALIPSRKNRLQPRPLDRHRYKARNLVERTFNWIKHFRRVATRFEKLDLHYAAMINLAGICKWLA